MLIETEKEFSDLMIEVRKTHDLTVDCETTGLEPWEGDRLIGIGLGLDDCSTYYLPFRHEFEDTLNLGLLPRLWAAIDKPKNLIGHNLKFDVAFMAQDGFVKPRGQRMIDTMSAARLCEHDKWSKLDLTSMLEKWFGIPAGAYDTKFLNAIKAIKLKKHQMIKVPIHLTAPYCEGDVSGTNQLLVGLEKYIEETDQTPVWQQEIEVTSLLWSMENVGLGFDQDYATAVLPLLQDKIAEVRGDIDELVGVSSGGFNPNSPKQLGEVLTKAGLKSNRRTKTGWSWDADVLKTLDHPIPKKILELRSVQKVEGTDIRPRMDRGQPTIHESIKSFGAITGRMSSPLHTFPKEGITVGEELIVPRALIVPHEEFTLYMADYSQMEMRVFADYIGDPELIALFDGGFDFHTYVAERVWGISVNHPEFKKYRNLAKAINFGLIFGIGKVLLGKNMSTPDQKVSTAEAQEYKEE